MTTTATPAAPATPADRPAPVDLTVTDDRHSRLYWAAADTWNVVRRSLTHFTRRPASSCGSSASRSSPSSSTATSSAAP